MAIMAYHGVYIFIYIYIYIYLFIYLSIYLFIYLSIYLFIYPFTIISHHNKPYFIGFAQAWSILQVYENLDWEIDDDKPYHDGPLQEQHLYNCPKTFIRFDKIFIRTIEHHSHSDSCHHQKTGVGQQPPSTSAIRWWISWNRGQSLIVHRKNHGFLLVFGEFPCTLW